MLDYKKIEDAVNSEVNAGDFSKLMQQFLQLGVQRYDYFVSKGFYRYYDKDEFVDLSMNGVPKKVSKKVKLEEVQAIIQKAQAGLINFEEFCTLVGKAGITCWQTDLINKTVTYIGANQIVLLVEPIPGM